MKYLLAILPLLLLLSLISCEPEDELITSSPEALLSFSGDTVLFDTVFVSQGSVTKRLKVFNPNKKAVRISGITLAGAASSPYQLLINGRQSAQVHDMELRGKDSLYILVKVNINPNDASLPFLVADSILFDTNGQRQTVKLVAYGQNAYFHRKEVTGTTTWPNDKPHVLLDTLLVPPGATLTIPKGTHVYAATKAVLLVSGQLLVAGTAEERVTFSGYRREADYRTAPGQWEGIRILAKSADNSIRYTDIYNTLYGLRIGNPGKGGTLVEGCKVAHAFLDGIVGYTSDVKVVNTLIYNCGQYSFGGLGGGHYEVLNSTLVNYENTLPRQTPALVLADYIPGTDIKDQPTSLRLLNTIVYSEGFGFKDEVLLEPGKDAVLEVAHNLLRTEEYKEQLSGNGNLLNVDPKFKKPAKADFSLDTLSPASGAARVLPGITSDLLGKKRDASNPDIGAYERSID
ncbi:right-handed parallel beta-helix repeat-containing protein [Pontibacter liquoris]|uniref:right-handed parallel beta-helix repeat-containing protein n=1 Tax=Pontibacter liquoris TaxID=2905677 RepID=UPI001FA6D453|nr:right-handed parallel beta-helix repeat-containing protein [Pontibacter liquoris]